MTKILWEAIDAIMILWYTFYGQDGIVLAGKHFRAKPLTKTKMASCALGNIGSGAW